MFQIIVCGVIAVVTSHSAVSGQGIVFEDKFTPWELPPPPEHIRPTRSESVLFSVDEEPEAPFQQEEVPSDAAGSDVILLRGGGQFDCRAPDGQNGRCGSFRQCLTLRKALVPLTSANIAYLRRSVCRNTQRRGQLLICCPPDVPHHLKRTTAPPLVFGMSRRTTPEPVTRPPVTKVTTPSPSTTIAVQTTSEESRLAVAVSTPSPTTKATTAAATAATEPPESGSQTAEPEEFIEGSGEVEAITQSPQTAENEVTDAPDTPSSVGTTVASTEAPSSDAPATETPTATVSSLPATNVSETGAEVTDGSVEGTTEVSEGPQEPLGLDICGYRNVSTERIIGGRIAEPHSWPWLAALGYNLEGDNIDYLCGGALLSDRHVLTAAHCIRSELRTVRLGDHHLFNETEVDTVTEHNVLAVFPHEEYNNKTFVNDIGIIKLRTPVPFSDAVHPVCIPSTEEMQKFVLVGKSTFIAGWGTTKFRGEASEILKEATVKVQRHQLCRARYRALRHKLVDTQICASTRGNDACQGDSGGPMMLPDSEDRWHVMGVVSFGFKCGEPRFPGVYTKVADYVDWIANNLR